MPNHNPGQRINGARIKGRQAAAAGQPKNANPYTRPNMAAAWDLGWEEEQAPTVTDDTQDTCDAGEQAAGVLH